jgi:hypothetical protein
VLVPADVYLLVLGDANPDLIVTGDVRPRFGQVGFGTVNAVERLRARLR